MLLEDGKKAIQLPVPEDAATLESNDFKDVLASAVKRFSVGFVKKIGLYVPPVVKQNPLLRQYRMPSGRSFQQLRQRLTANYDVELVDFESGRVASDVDVLLVLAPKQFTAIEIFAIDQYLMKGGTVIICSGAAEANFSQSALSASAYHSGIDEWLRHHGISIKNTLVLDPQNNIIPLPVTRNVGGMPVHEIKMFNYPYAIDVRNERLNNRHIITSGFSQIPVIWASPLMINQVNHATKATELLQSSEQSWSSSSMQILPEFDKFPEYGFPQENEPKSYVLGAVLEGEFKSFFKGKPDSVPSIAAITQNKDRNETIRSGLTKSILEQSLPSARLVVFSSNDFLTDKALRLLAGANGSVSLNAVNLIENTVDWAVEDSALLSIRNRGYYSRTLKSMPQSKQVFWEYLNYALALGGLLLVYLICKIYQRRKRRMHLILLREAGINV